MMASVARLSSDLNQAKGMVGSAMKNIESAVASAKAALGALGIGLGGGYFVSLIKGSIDAADHLGNLSKSTGVTVENLAGLRLLAQQTGTDLDGLAKGINKMSVEMGKNPEAFKALGITAKDNVGAVKQFADLFNTLPDINQRNALAQKVFSKSWAELAPAMAEGSKGIQSAIDKGKLLSGATKEMADEANKFNSQMAELNTTLGSATTKAIGPLLPSMNNVAEAMREAAKEGGLLLSIWVGLGGAMAMLLNIDVPTALKRNREIAALADDAAKLRKELEGAGMAALSPAWKARYQGELGVVNARLELLRRERDMEKEALTKGASGVDPKVAAAATARTKTFLNDGKEIESAYKAMHKALSEMLLTERERTEVNKLQLTLDAMMAKKRAEFKPGEEEKLKALAKEVDLFKQRNAQIENDAKNEEALTKMREEGAEVEAVSALRKGEALIAGYKQLEQMEFELKLIGLTNAEREVAIKMRELETREIDKQSESYEKLRDRMKEAILSRNAAEEAKRAQVSMWQSIESAGHQAFLSIFDTSKSVLERIRDMLKTHLLDILYQITLKPWIVQIAGAMSGAGVAQSAFGSTGGMGGIGNMLSGASSLFSGSGSSAWGAVSNFFSGGSSAATIAAEAAAYSGAGAMSAGAIAAEAAAYGAASAGTAAAAGAGAAAGAAAAIPYVGWAIAAYMLISSMSEKSGPKGQEIFMNNNRIGNNNITSQNPGYYQAASEFSDFLVREYTPEQLATTAGMRMDFAPGQDEMAALQTFSKRLLEALAPFKSSSQLSEEVAAFAVSVTAMKAALAAAQDPLGFWTGKVRDLGVELGSSASSTAEWSAQFAAALDGALTAEQFQKWVQFGEVITKLTDAEQARISSLDASITTLRASYQREASALAQTAAGWHNVADGLRAYGAVAGPMSYIAASDNLRAIVKLAHGGDIEAAGKLPDAAEAFRLASLANSGTALDYAIDLARIERNIRNAAIVADTQESIALEQRDLLTTQVESLIEINESVVTVAEAITILQAKIEELRASAADAGYQSKRTADILDAASHGQLTLSTEAVAS